MTEQQVLVNVGNYTLVASEILYFQPRSTQYSRDIEVAFRCCKEKIYVDLSSQEDVQKAVSALQAAMMKPVKVCNSRQVFTTFDAGTANSASSNLPTFQVLPPHPASIVKLRNK